MCSLFFDKCLQQALLVAMFTDYSLLFLTTADYLLIVYSLTEELQHPISLEYNIFVCSLFFD